MALEKAKGIFASFKGAFEAEPCDLNKCEELLAQLKLELFANLGNAGSDNAAPDLKLLTRDALELACFLSIRRQELSTFERHVSQLKMYYSDQQLKASEQKYPILGLYLLHLLASDRIGEFHTELELISVNDHDNIYIKAPIELERFIMEGNYSKVLEKQQAQDFPKMYYKYFMERLIETVRLKIGTSLERSYENLPAKEAANMLILNDIAALQEFALKENERKAREEQDDAMGDFTPSMTRGAPKGLVRWEVKDQKLFFNRTAEKPLELPAKDLMINTIGYATDLERIV